MIMDKSSDGLLRNKGTSRSITDIVAAITHSESPSTSAGQRNYTKHSDSARVIPGLASPCRYGENPHKNAKGVKRKFEENENETRKYKRQKKYRYTNTVNNRGEKRKFPFDYSEQPRKRFKSSSVENEHQQRVTLTKPALQYCESYNKSAIRRSGFKSDSETDDNINLDILPVAGTSGNRWNGDIEEADDNVRCPASCVCNAGHSRIPTPIKRYFETPVSMRKSVLMRMSFSRANKDYQCCPARCVRKLRRSTVVRTSLLNILEDYDESDLRVYKYSWGEWKE
ncbi:uncharacterized protein LOC132713302 isoform X2 [Ruditapes philippinarum]|uniref:uncharacterized protein LOC132713302 isoform X2 n=1 Tax=Ruditapes philippinarum TaxID=129788 RepID=UPI00295A9899|nr:uncharacterized protein LOC132713302 isoform X2 [Ruditapes philippinarum]